MAAVAGVVTRTGARTGARVIAVLAVLAVALVGLAGCGGSSGKGAGQGSTQSSATATAPAPSGANGVRTADPALKPAGMATIAESALPEEARDVLRRIDAGGPFKYRQDGVTFENRERLLPAEPRGYYREYTVTTPGAPDRGARRLIQGREGQLYYTPDHYRSFFWVVRGGGT
ncbi:MAG: ribonuclease N [Catenulispora sp.]|nr:ribonuclease N [Catenulispora sp.]